MGWKTFWALMAAVVLLAGWGLFRETHPRPQPKPRPVVVRGRCLDPERRALAGVAVELQGVETKTAISAADGSFEVRGIASEGAKLSLDALVYAIEVRDAVKGDADETDLGEIVFGPGVTMRGLVVDDDGRPVAGAEVSIGEPGGLMSTVKTGADGRFVAEHIGERPQLVCVREPHSAVEGHSLQLEAEHVDPADPDLRFVLTGARTLRVRFVDAVTKEPETVNKLSINWRRNGLLGGSLGTSGSAGLPCREFRVVIANPGEYSVWIGTGASGALTIPSAEITDEHETVIDVPVAKPPR